MRSMLKWIAIITSGVAGALIFAWCSSAFIMGHWPRWHGSPDETFRFIVVILAMCVAGGVFVHRLTHRLDERSELTQPK